MRGTPIGCATLVGKLVRSILRSVRYLRSRVPFVDDRNGPALFVAGSGRSGTTWLAEVLSMHLGARLVFEPFRPRVVQGLHGFGIRQYISPTAVGDPWKASVERIITGQLRSSWSDRYNNAFLYRSRVIKEIRANLILGWLLKMFPDIKVIHVVRDPHATIASQLIGAWPLDLKRFTSQPKLMNDYLEPFRPLIEDARDAMQIAVLHWAIENYVPLVQYRSGSWDRSRFRVFSYDRLCNDDGAMLDFMAFAGIRQEEVIWSSVRKPSRVSRGKQTFGRSTEVANGDSRQLAYIDRVLEEMDLRLEEL